MKKGFEISTVLVGKQDIDIGIWSDGWHVMSWCIGTGIGFGMRWMVHWVGLGGVRI